jgi:hypothetical protein
MVEDAAGNTIVGLRQARIDQPIQPLFYVAMDAGIPEKFREAPRISWTRLARAEPRAD